MLTAQRDGGLAETSYNDAVDKAGERGNAADEKGGNGTPVARKFGRVAVHAVEVVHVRYRHIAFADNVVAMAQDKRISGHGLVGGSRGRRTRS